MRAATMEDVAREAGVSRSLVSIAFRGVVGVSDETRNRIFEAATRLDYRPNRVASRLASKKSNTIGVFLLDLHNDLFADMYDGLRAILESQNIHMVLSVGAIDGSMDEDALEVLLQSRVDLIIAAGLLLSDQELSAISRLVPIVSVSRDVPGLDSVCTDNVSGITQATEHLHDLGHSRILFLGNPQTDGYRDRQEGYWSAMKNFGLTPQVVPSSYSRLQCSIDIGAILDGLDRPTAIIAHNDQAALGVLDAMTLRGLHAPEDLSVVGYDNSSVSRAPGSGLTTVDIHGVELGALAATLAIERLRNTPEARLTRTSTPTLVVRRTSGPVSTLMKVMN